MSQTGQLFVDPQRCIGCRACEAACAECEDHPGSPNAFVDESLERGYPRTSPSVCMHCGTCAWVCPADAIDVDDDGIVHTAHLARCIACGNCAAACPFGIPKVELEVPPMRKCDLCFGRSSRGLTPLCAAVCPSGALYYGTSEEMAVMRPHSASIRRVRIGEELVVTRTWLMVPPGTDTLTVSISRGSAEGGDGKVSAKGSGG